MESEALQHAEAGKTEEEKKKLYNDFISRYDVEGSRMDDLHQATMQQLSFQKFYTVGKSYVSSWLVPEKTTAEEAVERMQTSQRLKSVDVSHVQDWKTYGGTHEKLDENKRWRKYRPDYFIEDEE